MRVKNPKKKARRPSHTSTVATIMKEKRSKLQYIVDDEQPDKSRWMQTIQEWFNSLV